MGRAGRPAAKDLLASLVSVLLIADEGSLRISLISFLFLLCGEKLPSILEKAVAADIARQVALLPEHFQQQLTKS